MANGRAHKYGDGRDALLAAVVAVVAEKGLRGLTYRAVADHAGVNNTLISHHFGSRSALLEAAMEWASARSIRLSDLSATEEVNAEFAQALVELVQSEPELQLFQYEMILESRRKPELRPAAVKLYDSYVESMQQALQKHGYQDTAPLARAIFAALDGLVLQQLTVSDPGTVREAIVRIGALLEKQPTSLNPAG
ncbi:TetR/AcrR family transcriptional regulator [Arthrobacter crystallopoietes]|uniref:DNA-binding transcriptional regulator, AcrR family n=1 Tax=Crystallibacter crystallopoietes TaxID=37928 RepID=A0A1H1D9Q4_9MICC|nr:TetR family transcriptional regulator [Arthrobacter crystallopoietes]AUI50422.1 TetR family transcriptional regulator [Arthrobacter crystallopoietes]SDQ72576.1 DNA-binding transcriptional regulator, AcrR family [Arthrobacter crystallopoietes]